MKPIDPNVVDMCCTDRSVLVSSKSAHSRGRLFTSGNHPERPANAATQTNVSDTTSQGRAMRVGQEKE